MSDLNKEFIFRVRNFVDKTTEEIELIQKKTAIELYRMIINRTPIDVGVARANWFVTSSAPSSRLSEGKEDIAAGKRPPLDATGPTVDAMVSKVEKIPLGKTIYMTNNAPYILRLEYGLYPRNSSGTKTTAQGYSTQAPNGMVRLSLKEVGNKLR